VSNGSPELLPLSVSPEPKELSSKERKRLKKSKLYCAESVEDDSAKTYGRICVDISSTNGVLADHIALESETLSETLSSEKKNKKKRRKKDASLPFEVLGELAEEERSGCEERTTNEKVPCVEIITIQHVCNTDNVEHIEQNGRSQSAEQEDNVSESLSSENKKKKRRKQDASLPVEVLDEKKDFDENLNVCVSLISTSVKNESSRESVVTEDLSKESSKEKKERRRRDRAAAYDQNIVDQCEEITEIKTKKKSRNSPVAIAIEEAVDDELVIEEVKVEKKRKRKKSIECPHTPPPSPPPAAEVSEAVTVEGVTEKKRRKNRHRETTK